jgi:DNA ligase-1
MTLLADVVATSERVAATSKRTEKVALLADLLRQVDVTEVEPVVGFLVGWPRQGKVGVGWATLGTLASSVPAASEASVSIRDVDDALERVARTSGSGSTSQRQATLGALFTRCTEREQHFLRRLLLGDMRQGANEGVLTDAIARAAGVPIAAVRRAAMLSGDLGRAASVALHGGGQAGLQAIGLTVLNPVEPMLAASAPSVAEALALTGPASIEWKLDGARIQVHKDGERVQIFTRNLNDVTYRLPGIVAVTQSLPAHRLVLDGEAMGIDEDGRPRIFQDTMSEFGTEVNAGALAGFFFDVLHIDGRDTIDEPLTRRAALLDEIAGRWRIPALVTADADVAAAFLDDAVGRGHEGVMVKALDAPYDAGRRGGAWRKVKPVRTLDLVVLAAEWGHGRRRGWLSNLHLGARGPDGTFVMVGKTFKGMTDELLRWQTERFPQLEIGRDDWTVYLRPELVVEIALDGVQASRRYPGGVALRFARVRRYREDKPASDADTIETVQAMLPGRAS